MTATTSRLRFRIPIHFPTSVCKAVCLLLTAFLSFRPHAAVPPGAVVAWGDAWGGKTAVPYPLNGVVAVGAGNSHVVAARSDGSVATWGVIQTIKPSVLPDGISNVVAVAAGTDHSLFLQSDGTVLSVGLFVSGQVFPFSAKATAIAAGAIHGVLLRTNGVVQNIGSIRTDAPFPVGGITNAVAIAAGSYHSLAVRNDGTVICWGRNDYGQCNPPSGLSNVIAVAGGNYHSTALKSDGTVVCWGANFAFSDIVNQSIPPPGLSNVVAIAAGAYHNLALKQDGTVTAWGWDGYGQCTIPPGLSNVVAISAGLNDSLAITTDPVVVRQPADLVVTDGASAALEFAVNAGSPLSYQWMFNGQELIGETNSIITFNPSRLENDGRYEAQVRSSNRSIASRVARVQVSGLPAITNQPSGRLTLEGDDVLLSVTAFGTEPLSYQWLQSGVPVEGETTPELSLVGIKPEQGGNYRVVVKNALGEIASTDVSVQVIRRGPVIGWGFSQPPAGVKNIVAAASGGGSWFGLTASHRVIGWTGTSPSAPLDVPGLTNVIQIAAGSAAALALRADGSLVSWGSEFSGIRRIPVAATNVISIAASDDTALAIRQDRTVVSVGDFIQVPAGLSDVKSVGLGTFHRVALKNNGTVVVWGQNDVGQLNVPSGMTNVVAIAVGEYHTLALLGDGTVRAWGHNGYGQSTVPPGLSNVVQIAADDSHSLALTRDGKLVAWGSNDRGEGMAPRGLEGVRSIFAKYSNLLILDWPIFNEEPIGQQTPEGGAVSFNVDVTSESPSTIQWQFNGIDLPGETNSVLRLSNVRATNDGVYTLLASNKFGSVLSEEARLSVLTPPRIVEEPKRFDVGLHGDATFSVSASGSAPLTYFWFHEGALFSTTTGSTLSLANVNSSAAGLYSVTVSNVVGMASSPSAPLVVHFSPTIARQPESFAALSGETVNFTVSAEGEGPFFYQWFFNDLPVSGATNSDFSVTLAQPKDEGTYSARIGNAWGNVLSQKASLTVTNRLSVALDPSLIFRTGGDNVWNVQTNITHDGVSAAQSGAISNAQTVWMETKANGPGILTFWWRVSSEEGFDFVLFQVIGGESRKISGETDWIKESVRLPAGEVTLRWTYAKDETLREGLDAAWVDEVQIIPDAAPSIDKQPLSVASELSGTVVFHVTAVGEPSPSFQWFFNGGPIPGATGSTYKIDHAEQKDAGFYRVIASNSQGTATSDNAELIVRAEPAFREPLKNRFGFEGGTVSFVPAVYGSGPFLYQWKFNGHPITDGTNSMLSLTNLTFAAEGIYSVTVQNPFGSAASSLATLSMARSSTLIDFEDRPAPCVFSQAHALADQYLGSGISISGVNGYYVAAIVSDCGGPSVQGYSGTNFMMFHSSGRTAEGQYVRLPVAFAFRSISAFQLKVGGINGFLSLDAYNDRNELVDRTPISLSNPIQPFAVSGTNISKVILNGDEFTFCLVDDLEFTSEPDVQHRPVQTRIERDSGEIQISWPAYASGVLVQTTDIGSPLANWETVADSPASDGAVWRVRIPSSGSTRYFQFRPR